MKSKKNELVGGILLVSFGLLALLGQFINLSPWMGLLVLPIIGGIFLLAGIIARNVGFMIPGGILSGIGLGAFLIEGPLNNLEGDAEGAVFMLSFACGWALITILSALFTKKTQWWPLIPGGIMAFIGGGLLFGGAFISTLTLLGKVWPVFLIASGVYVIFKGYRSGTIMQ
ncbi:MAG: hypothetical protein R3E31_17260 [Chloroflexota bacterium]|nr:hypothetical protein [Ardenticatenaceae bacterium]